MKPKKVIVVGSTGSIGQSAIHIIRQNPELLQAAGLSAHSNKELLLRQAHDCGIANIALTSEQKKSDNFAYIGERGAESLIRNTKADIVLNGISGSAGLGSSIAALESGKDLALANKETVVMAGPLILSLASSAKKKIIPVDSEHSAIFHLLSKTKREAVQEIVLTASGGAFRDLPLENLEQVTYKDALSHPTWNMGNKITVDSATMANKGLEIIEAHELFHFPLDKIKVVIHPQSYVHSLIKTVEGSMYAQISKPDMRIPIQNALTFPEVHESPYGLLDLSDCTFTFQKPEKERFPCLDIARTAAAGGGSYPLCFNASNEAAVAAFAEGRIKFTQIARVILSCLDGDWGNLLISFDQVFEMDQLARRVAGEIIDTLA